MTAQAGIVLRHLRGMAVTGDVPDSEFLRRFTVGREEAAFAALVRRHGPMVLGVCRRVLRQEQDAEDAFQAAFLALARKAPSIGKRDSVGSWLYQVAVRVAMKARQRTANRQRRERKSSVRQPADPLAEITGRELLAVFDEELSKLPERQRAPLVLCYLQGLTRDLAARQLGCSESTLHRRLDEARERLRERLSRRGLALPAALLAAGAVAGGVPAMLSAAGVRSALGKAAVPPAVASLAREALRGAPRHSAKAVGALLLAAGLVAATAGLVAAPPPAAGGGAPPPAEVKPPDPAAAPRPAEPAAEKADYAVSGAVVDDAGKPVAGAKVAVIGLVEPTYRGRVGERGHKVLANGEAGKDGRFRLDCAPATPSRLPIRQLLASAPGHGLGWLLLAADADKGALTIKLPAEQVIRGRLLDLQGQAAAGVKLHVAEVTPAPAGGTGSTGGSGFGGLGGGGTFTGTLIRADPEAAAPPWYDFPAQPAKLGAWPAAVTTDDEGRFTVRGVGADLAVTLVATDDRFAPQRLVVSTAAKDKPGAVERVVEQARWLEGKVVGEDTGKPIGKRVLLELRTQNGMLQTWADEKGTFRVNCPPGRLSIEPFPPDGSPYLSGAKRIEWPKGQTKHEVAVTMPRGVLVRGKVTEAESGKPVAGAVLTYYPRRDNPLLSVGISSWRRSPGEFVRTTADGTFEATVFPGAGTLLARGPTHDYVLEPLDSAELLGGRAPVGGRRGPPLYTHGSSVLDLKAGADPQELSLKLRRGVTVKGQVLDPDGKPVKSAVLYHPLGLRDNGDLAYFSPYSLEPIAVRDGTFAVTGLDPKAKVQAIILDREKDVGGRVAVSGKAASDEVTVKLQPCAKVKARLLESDGKPRKGLGLGLQLALDAEALPFIPQRELLEGSGPEAEAEAERRAVARGAGARPHRPQPRREEEYSDAEGRITVGGLIPGATYRYFDGKKWQEFTAESGKTHDIGDVSVPTGGAGGGAGGLGGGGLGGTE